jgi:hypothetical protein
MLEGFIPEFLWPARAILRCDCGVTSYDPRDAFPRDLADVSVDQLIQISQGRHFGGATEIIQNLCQQGIAQILVCHLPLLLEPLRLYDMLTPGKRRTLPNAIEGTEGESRLDTSSFAVSSFHFSLLPGHKFAAYPLLDKVITPGQERVPESGRVRVHSARNAR